MALSLEFYEHRIQSYSIRWGGDVVSGTLIGFINRWRQPPPNDVTGEGFLKLLREEYTKLEKRSESYAERWSKEVKGSSTIS
jgi:hypothetical protein